MKIGSKIKLIREFRGYSQVELAKKIHIADTMMRDYEAGRRTPKENRLREIAKELHASYEALAPHYDSLLIEAMETLFWLEESIGNGKVDLFGFEKVNDNWQKNLKEPWKYKAVMNNYDPEGLVSSVIRNPIGITINDLYINRSLEEWLEKKHGLIWGKITKEEYFEWKINWPESADGCGVHDPLVN